MNFSKEMEMLTLVEKEFNQLESDGSWHSIYLAIRNKSSSYGHSVLEAKKIVNKNLNRYRDVSPYDHSRVILEKGKCDYINASLVKVPEANREYILTQGPLPETAGHFWLMVWEQKTKAIIMLNKIIEKDQIKCHYYWIEDANSPLIFQEEGLRIDFLAQTEESDFITREFRITDQESGETRSVFQFHFLTWPDFGVPSSPASFLHFLEYVRNTGTLDLSPETGPPVVHCSAGIGRSGTFCLVDSCLIMLKDEDGPSKVSVQQLLLDMRHYRMGLIQTPEQLRFSYLAIIEALKEMKEKTVIPLFPYVSDSGIENGVLEEEPDGEGIEEEEEVPPPIESLPPPVPPRSQSLPSSPVTLTQEEEEREMPISNKPLPSLPSSVEESSEEHEWEDIDEALPDIELSAVGDYSIGLDDARKRNNEERTVGTEPKKLKSDLAVDSTLANGNGAVAGMKDFNVPDVTTKLCPEESEPKVRQRRKDNKLEEKVRKIKQKMEASERSQRRKAMLCSPYAMAVGGMLLLLTGVVAYKYFS